MMSNPKKLKKFRVRRLLVLGLCNLTSGIVFGAGCLIAEHIDSSWWQSRDGATPEKVAASETTRN